jgi:hypothetical protein
VSKTRRILVFFIALPFLCPARGFPQNGRADSPGELRALLKDRGISWEEDFLFSASGEEGGAAEAGLSLLIFFPGGAASSGGEDSAGTAPLMIAAFPLRRGESPAEDPGRRFALALIEEIRAREAAGRGLPGGLLIAFLGDGDLGQFRENGGRGAGELSSYNRIIREPGNTVFWFFGLEDAPPPLLVHHGTGQTIAPLESLKNLAGLFSSLKIPYRFAVPFNEMYRLGLAGGPEILRFAQERGMRALYFSGAPGPGRGAPDAAGEEALVELVLSRAASRESPGGNQDYHYLFFSLGGKTVFLSQEHTALALFLMAAAFFLGFLLYRIFRPAPPARLTLFLRCFWTVPAFFLLLFVSLEAAGLAASLLAGTETRIPFIYGWAVWKLLLGLGLFALISIPLGGYRIPRRADFYGRCALILIILDVFIAAWADICFIPFFTGAFLLIFAGSQIKRPVPVYLCALLAPFYGFTAAAFSIRSGYGGLGSFLLSSSPGPTALMILVFLPFVLLFKRAMNLRRREKRNILRRMIPFFVLLGLALILGIVLTVRTLVLN